MAGRDVEFDCQVEGDPIPKIFWQRDYEKMPASRARILDSQSLHITNVVPQDEGIYICAAENVVGSISAKASLEVHSKLHLGHINSKI